MRLINSLESLETYINLLVYTKENIGYIPEHMLMDMKHAIYGTTYGMKLRFFAEIQNKLPEHYKFFVEE